MGLLFPSSLPGWRSIASGAAFALGSMFASAALADEELPALGSSEPSVARQKSYAVPAAETDDVSVL